jgi:hypothetical protein
MWSSILVGIGMVVASADALADQAGKGVPPSDEILLKQRLDQLESRTIQRQGRARKLGDLLIEQDRRLADQKLKAFKTRKPTSPSLPLLERSFDRSRKPGRLFESR